MNPRWLASRLPDPAEVRRRLGLVAAASAEREADGRTERWRARLGRALRDPVLWCPTRRSVAGGVATGLFTSWIPVPFQMLLAAVLASVLRVHVPVSVVMVWFTNPLTIAPLLYVAWRTGSTLLGLPPRAPPESERVVGALLARLGEAWPAVLAGCLFWAAASAVVGYAAVQLAWRVATVRRWRRRACRPAPSARGERPRPRDARPDTRR